jgi:hypothetical protein
MSSKTLGGGLSPAARGSCRLNSLRHHSPALCPRNSRWRSNRRPGDRDRRIEGLAPYFFEFAPTFYFSNRGFFGGASKVPTIC